MVDVARINLYGQPIGSVRWDRRYEIAQFEYNPDFVRQGIAFTADDARKGGARVQFRGT